MRDVPARQDAPADRPGEVVRGDLHLEAMADLTSKKDTPKIDGPVKKDLGPAPLGCSSGFTNIFAYASNMILCQTTGSAFNQCKAAGCAAPGHLCTASEFRARGGVAQAAPAVAWLAGCIRSGGSSSAPTDMVCGDCSGFAQLNADLAWSCSSGAVLLNSDAVAVGLATASTCRRVGTNSATTAAYWKPLSTEQMLQAVVCCN